MSLRKGCRERVEKGQTRYKTDALPRVWRYIIEHRVGVRPHQSITERRTKEIKGDKMESYHEREKIVRFRIRSYKFKSKGNETEGKLESVYVRVKYKVSLNHLIVFLYYFFW